jgi:hypothetical protein
VAGGTAVEAVNLMLQQRLVALNQLIAIDVQWK